MAVGAATADRFVIDLPDSDSVLSLAGAGQKTLKQIEAFTGAFLVTRGLQLVIAGKPEQIEKAAGVVELLRPIWQSGQVVSMVELKAALASLDDGTSKSYSELGGQVLARSQRGQLLRPRTLRQRAYFEAMQNHELTFALGPAGTGKTFLAAVLAVRMLTERKVGRIVLTRPALEAGERLGFLPGDLQQKVDPYLRPLYDALHALIGLEKTTTLLEKGVIEVAPLAYMRGRTLDNSFVILDEAQNTTSAQMRMVLTRLGEHSRMVVTGDETQLDLPGGETSGLVEASGMLKDIDGVAVCRLNSKDIVRHELVQRIVDAYSKFGL